MTPTGRVFEVQHSGLSADDIRERERFYGPEMTWIWDARDPYENERLWTHDYCTTWDCHGGKISDGSCIPSRYPRCPDCQGTGKRRDGKHAFRWKHPRTTLAACRRRLLLDLDGETLLSVHWNGKGFATGNGRLVSRQQVTQLLNKEPS
ncbi:MAG: hypothetical protein ABR616_18125 [Dermatophilaceae bacterium]|nr:hypothetical protein [Intrasporangiaceae bacterium]